MIVPEYWAEAKIHKKIEGRSVTIKRFGWSDESPEDAQSMADQRAREAMDAKIAGEDVRRIDHKIAYNGAEGLPIREEVISRLGEQVITRNSYGSLCLNSPDVFFADLDFEDFRITLSSKPFLLVGLVLWLALSVWLIIGLGANPFESDTIFAFLFFPILICMVLYPVKLKLEKWKLEKLGGIEQVMLKRIEEFSDREPSRIMRVYRTPFGMRILFMEKTYAPQSGEVAGVLGALNADSLYSTMCRRQNCFRARISPKPWRMGMERLKKTGVWPLSEERLKERRKWVDQYEREEKSFASARYLLEFGCGTKDKTCEVVRKIHDEYCRADSVLDLA